jgi:flavodoxin
MRELIIYYTHGGHTRIYAEKRAQETGADLAEVLLVKPKSKIGAFCPGVPQSWNLKRLQIKPLNVDFENYDKIVICAPVWAGAQAAPINAAIDLIPAGKAVEGVLVSGGGDAKNGKYPEIFAERGITDFTITNIKGSEV